MPQTQALLDGDSPKRIPIMTEIVAMTLEAYSAREGCAAPMSHREAQVSIGALLAHAGMTEAYLHGYLTGLAITPLETTPETWLGALLGDIAFQGEGALDKEGLVAEVFLRFKLVQQPDPTDTSPMTTASLMPPYSEYRERGRHKWRGPELHLLPGHDLHKI